jgi:hypothetical protein
MTISEVFLVEDHTRGYPSDGGGYWAKAYVSQEDARRRVEHYAPEGDLGAIRWEEGSFGTPTATDAAGERKYVIVPLQVHQRGAPEEP